jgi:hypothetical protein
MRGTYVFHCASRERVAEPRREAMRRTKPSFEVMRIFGEFR